MAFYVIVVTFLMTLLMKKFTNIVMDDWNKEEEEEEENPLTHTLLVFIYIYIYTHLDGIKCFDTHPTNTIPSSFFERLHLYHWTLKHHGFGDNKVKVCCWWLHSRSLLRERKNPHRFGQIVLNRDDLPWETPNAQV